MTRYHNTNGVQVQYTAEEETARDAEQAQDVINLEAKRNLTLQKEADRAAGNQKLLDLGLSQAEVDALVG
jgi:hypothetical protein